MFEHVEIGDSHLYLGDCLEVMGVLDPACVDAVVSDPPFAFAGGISNGMASRADSQFFEHWLVDVFHRMNGLATPESAWLLWCDWRTASVYDRVLADACEDNYTARMVSQVIIHDREWVGSGATSKQPRMSLTATTRKRCAAFSAIGATPSLGFAKTTTSCYPLWRGI